MINLVSWLKSTTQVPIPQVKKKKNNGKGKNQEEEEEDDVSYSLDRIKKLKDVIWKTS